MTIKSLLCLNHTWQKAPSKDQLWRAQGKTKWICTKCNKITWRNNVEPPVRESLDTLCREAAKGKPSGGDHAARCL